MKYLVLSFIIIYSGCVSSKDPSFMNISLGQNLEDVLKEKNFNSCISSDKNQNKDVQLIFSKKHPCEKKTSSTYFCQPSPVFVSTLLVFNSNKNLYHMTFTAKREEQSQKEAFSGLQGKFGAPKETISHDKLNDEWSLNQFMLSGIDCKKYSCTKEFWTTDEDKDKYISFSIEDKFIKGKRLLVLHAVNFKMFEEVNSVTEKCITEASKDATKKLGF